MQADKFDGGERQKFREPLFNLPASLTVLIAIFIVIHLVRTWFLSPLANLELITYSGFIPGRFAAPTDGLLDAINLYLTPFSYSLLHGNWMHLGLNSFWLMAFGTPVARRFGSARFFGLAAATSLGGAIAHFLSYPDGLAPMIGASAIVSGMMGAASRFMFNGHYSFGSMGVENFPASSLAASFANRQFLIFVGIWFGLNYLFGAGIDMSGSQEIAWQAHIGGFVVGILLFSWFDPGHRHQRWTQ